MTTWPPTNEPAVRDAILSVLERGVLVGGPEVEGLEQEFARAMGLDHAVALSSGTTAITAALLAAGLKSGDRVVVPAFTFSGSVLPVLHIGAVPLFLDVEEDTFCLDPARAVEAAIKFEAQAVVLVHLHGYPVYVGSDLRSEMAQRGIRLIEDACQAAGAHFPDTSGAPVGGQGEASAYSLNERKQVFGGEGGVFATSSSELADRVRRLRRYGEPIDQPDSGWRSYQSLDVGYNWKLAEIPAAMARVSLRQLERRTELAGRNASILHAALCGTSLKPPRPPKGRHAWHKYRVGCSGSNRDTVMGMLRTQGVPVSLWQTSILPDMPAFLPWAAMFDQDFPAARRILRETFVVGDETRPLCATTPDEVGDWAQKLSTVCR